MMFLDMPNKPLLILHISLNKMQNTHFYLPPQIVSGIELVKFGFKVNVHLSTKSECSSIKSFILTR